MSRVLFHSRDEPTAEVLGAERAWMWIVTRNLAYAFVPHFEDEVRPYLVPGLEVRPGQWFNTDVRLWLGTDRLVFHLDGKPLDSFHLMLNTAIAVGSDPVCLMARLHAQCEIHGYVEGPDRAWFADVIEQGRKVGLFRDGAGWEPVVDLLRCRDDAPVVTSYTVCDGFPNPQVAGWEPPASADGEDDESGWDLWYDLPESERWDAAIRGLRGQAGMTPIAPETLREHLFGHGRTLLDVFHSARAPVVQ